MERNALERLDAFPFRHRLAEVMTSPVAVAAPELPLVEAARRMAEAGISSLLVAGDGGIAGIVTERDVLRAAARLGGDFARTPLAAIMSAPVESLPGDVHVYRAIGRMDRLGVRHLAVSGEDGGIVGMVTARRLLKLRAGGALALGDRIDVAANAADLAAARGELAGLARQLLAEQVPALEVAGVISAVLRDISGRAAALAEKAVTARLGPAPTPWCLLVLGSGGRGESLLGADQDNAIVHGGGDDQWYATVGSLVAETLDQAGIPLCRGNIMASNPVWRGSLEDWYRRVEHWLAASSGRALLDVDIFYDFRPVHGDISLADRLRRAAVQAAASSTGFLRYLAESVSEMQPPLGLFGRVITEGGRVDLKRGGVLPLVAGARVMALKHKIAATDTAGRLRAVAEGGRLAPGDVAGLLEAQEFLMRLMLEQQLADLAAGAAPGNKVEISRLDRAARKTLRHVLRRIRDLEYVVRDALSSGP